MLDKNGTNGRPRRPVTPAGRRLLDVLEDGRPHSYEELFAVLDFPPGWVEAERNAAKQTLQNHISDLRKAVSHKGLDVVCQFMHRTKRYRLMRTVSNGS